VTEVEQKYGEITGKEKNLRVMTHDSCVLWHGAIHFYEILIKKVRKKRQVSLQRNCAFVQYFIEFFCF
jgi:hypothetical protein